MNLGSPDSTSVPDVRKYLKEFLMDGRVIDSPYILRAILVRGIITPFRAPKSAEAYRAVWTKDGSPLVAITHQQQRALQAETEYPVGAAMRYGNPTMKWAYDDLMKQYPNLKEVFLIPLYPHYAMSSYETAVEHARDTHKAGGYPFSISFMPPFYNNAPYLQALAHSIRPYLKAGKHLLFSYHSIPERHIEKSDVTHNHCLKTGNCCTTPSAAHPYCYRHQCLETTRLVAALLGLSTSDYSVAFQSKLGRSAWLTPATTARMGELPKEGIKDLLVVCPSFVSDCLETLEEIAIREKENFMEAGGQTFEFIPCMNTQAEWINVMAGWIKSTFPQ